MPIMCRHDINMIFFFFFYILKKNRIIKEILDYCSSKKIVSKGSFIFHRQQVVYKHHQNLNLTQKLRMSFENEILRRCLFLWDTLSENKLEPR